MVKATQYPTASISIKRTGKAAKRPDGKKQPQKLEIDATVDPELYGAALLAAGQAHAAAGNFQEAAAALQTALDFHAKLYGAQHAIIIDCCLNLAEALRRTSDLKGAREMIEAAAELTRTDKGVSTIQQGLVLNERAALDLHFNDFKAAQPAAEQSLQLLEEAGDPRRTLPMDTLARMHFARGQYAEANDMYVKMAAIDSATFLGAEHPRHIAHLHNQATVLQAIGDSTAALKAFKKVAKSIEARYGETYADLPTVYANLGRLEQDRNDFEAAEGYFERARKLTKKLMGEKHPFYGYDLANLGRLALDQGEPKEAQQYLKDAIAIYRKAYDRPHAYTASALTFLAYTQLDLEKPDAASESAHEALDLWEQIGKQCDDRGGDAGTCNRAFAKVLWDVAQAACQTKDGEPGVIVCQDWDTMDGKLQKSDIRRRLLALLLDRGCIKKAESGDCNDASDGPQQLAAAGADHAEVNQVA